MPISFRIEPCIPVRCDQKFPGAGRSAAFVSKTKAPSWHRNTMLGIVCLDARIVNPLSLARLVPHPDARGRFRLVASRSLCVSEKTGKVSISSARGALCALIDRQRERILNDLTGMGAHRRTDVVKFHNYLPLSFDGIGPESDVLFGGRKV